MNLTCLSRAGLQRPHPAIHFAYVSKFFIRTRSTSRMTFAISGSTPDELRRISATGPSCLVAAHRRSSVLVHVDDLQDACRRCADLGWGLLRRRPDFGAKGLKERARIRGRVEVKIKHHLVVVVNGTEDPVATHPGTLPSAGVLVESAPPRDDHIPRRSLVSVGQLDFATWARVGQAVAAGALIQLTNEVAGRAEHDRVEAAVPQPL
jgi:hypothetical protein